MSSTTQDIRLTCVLVSIFYKSLVQKHVVLSSVSTSSFLEKNEKILKLTTSLTCLSFLIQLVLVIPEQCCWIMLDPTELLEPPQ